MSTGRARERELWELEQRYPERQYLRDEECDTTELAQGRPIFNGCTTVWLKERHGADRVHHHMGVGWYLTQPAGR